MLDLSSGEPFTMHSMELPASVRSVHPMSQSHFLVSSSGDNEGVYLLKKDKDSDPMPSVFVPIRGSKSGGGINSLAMDGGLSGVGLRAVLGEAVDAPNTLFASDANYASLVVGFPELEFSSNEVYAWPKSEEPVKPDETSRPALNAPYVAKKYLDRG